MIIFELMNRIKTISTYDWFFILNFFIDIKTQSIKITFQCTVCFSYVGTDSCPCLVSSCLSQRSHSTWTFSAALWFSIRSVLVTFLFPLKWAFSFPLRPSFYTAPNQLAWFSIAITFRPTFFFAPITWLSLRRSWSCLRWWFGCGIVVFSWVVLIFPCSWIVFAKFVSVVIACRCRLHVVFWECVIVIGFWGWFVGFRS